MSMFGSCAAKLANDLPHREVGTSQSNGQGRGMVPYRDERSHLIKDQSGRHVR